MNKYKSLASNTIIFAIGNLGSRLITFFLVPFYTNVLTTAEYGIADLVTTCANIIVPIFSLVIQDAVLRFGLSKEYDQKSVFKNAIIILCIGAIASLCIVPALDYYEPLKEWKIYLYVTALSIMASNILFSYARAKEMNMLYAVGGMVNTLVLATTNVLFLAVFHIGVKGYLLANIIGQIVAVILLFVFTKAYKDILTSKYDKLLMREMIVFSAPLIINNLSWWILNSSDRLMVEHFCSAADLGLYTAASKIPALLSIITTIFSQAWTVSAIKDYDSEKDKKFYESIYRLLSFVMFLGCSALILIIKPFMHVYVGTDFFESWRMVPFLLVGAVFFSFSSFFGAIYGALKKNFKVALTTFVAAIINVLINFWLLPEIGVVAAAISTAIGYLVIGIYRMLDSQKMFRFSIDYLRFAINSIIIVLQTAFVFFDFNIYVVSVCAILLILIVNRKDIKEFIKTINAFVKEHFGGKKTDI